MALLLGCVDFASADIRIGVESAVTVPSSADYSSVVNVRPGNGEIVSNNPPIFSWFYSTLGHLAGGDQNPNGFANTEAYRTNAFRLQIATNSTFTGNLQADVNTFHNFYNFLPVLDTNASRQMWWRVIYSRTNTPVKTNTYTFTIAVGATNWDRSMFADRNYLATNGVHPAFAFRAGEQASIYAWEQTQPDFVSVLNAAKACTNAAYFKNHALWGTNSLPNPSHTTVNPPDAYDRYGAIGAVLHLWALSGDNRWTNASMTGWLVTNIYHAQEWYMNVANNYPYADIGFGAGTPHQPALMAAAYDWMYHYLDGNTATFNGRLRTNLLYACRAALIVQTHYGAFYQDSETGNPANGRIDYNYPQTQESVWPYSVAKLPHSHIAVTMHTCMPIIVATQSDDKDCRMAFDWMLNFMLARTTPFAGFAAHHAGPYGYANGHVFGGSTGNGVMQALLHLDSAWPDAQLSRTDFCRGFPEWYCRLHPYRMRKLHGPWGDGGPYGEGDSMGYLGRECVGLDMARVCRSALARRLFDLNANQLYPQNAWAELPARWHYIDSLPAAETNASTSKLFLEDGYVTASSLPVSDPGCYTNGVGFSLRASPRGSTGGHNTYADGSVDIWAYGSQLTDGGGSGLNAYDYEPDSSPTLFVESIGQTGPGYGSSPRIPVAASISAFTNSGTNFVYSSADLSGLFTNYWSEAVTSNVVTSVKRHVLFVRSKYFVFFDQFRARSNSMFAFRWHVPWLYRYVANGLGSAAGNEGVVRAGTLFCSNSLSLATNGFNYVAGNITGSGNFGINLNFTDFPQRIPVTVIFANATNQYGVYVATGTENMDKSVGNVYRTSQTNSTLNPYRSGGRIFQQAGFSSWAFDRAAGLWVTNKVRSTSWDLMTVIVPQEPGKSAPTIQRLADNAVAVTYDGVTETNVFGTSYTGAYTYMIDLDQPSRPAKVVPKGPARLN